MDALSAAARLAALERESPLAARLAEAASLAVRVDAGLLRRLRQTLLPEADPGAESDLWFSAIVESRGTTGFQLAGSVLPLLRQRLQADPARFGRAAAITREAHAGAAQAIRLEEALNMLALRAAGAGLQTINDVAAAELEPALRTLAQGGDAALAVARWAVRAAGRLDERVRRTRAAQTLLLAASLRLGMRRTLADPARPDLPLDLLARVLPASGARRSVGVVQVAGGLQFRTPEDGIASFEAPDTDPLLVGLSWQAGGTAHERTVEVLPLAVVRLDGEPDEVIVTTLAGERYRLGSAQGGEPQPLAGQRQAGPTQPDERWLAACLRLAPPDGSAAPRGGFIVESGLGLTVADELGSAALLVDALSGRRFERAAGASSSGDEARDDRLVALRPVDGRSVSQSALPIGQSLPDHAVAASVAGFAADGVLRWFDVVVQPRSADPRTALLPTAAGLGDAPQALAGAPLVDASGVVAAVLGAEALADGSSGVRLTLVEARAMNDALQRASLQRRSQRSGPSLQVRVVHGDIRQAPSPLLVGHYDDDGICGVERQLDELLDRQLSQRLAVGLYPGALGTHAQWRLPATDGLATPAVLVVGLGAVGQLSSSALTDTLRSGLLAAAIEPGREPVDDVAPLQASSLLIGSGEGGVGVAASAIAIVEAALRANASLASSATDARYQSLTIVEAVAERATEALSALQRWVKGSASDEAVQLEPRVERRKPPKDLPSGDWWHRLRVQADDRGAFGYALTAGGGRSETVPDGQRRLADSLLAITADPASTDPQWLRTLSELLIPGGLFSPLLMVDRLALQLDAQTAAYPWELMDPDRPSRGMPPLAARLGLVRQFVQPARAAAVVDAGNAAAVFVADGEATPASQASALTRRMVQDVASRLEGAGLKAPSFVNPAAADLMARLLGEPLRLLHLAAPLAWPAAGGADVRTGFRFGPDLVLTPAEIAQMRSVPQLVFASDSGRHQPARARKDWPRFAASFAEELLRVGVRAVVMPGWPLEPRDADGFTAAFYDALVKGLNFGDCVLFARGEAWKRNPKSLAWAAFQCWGNPGLTLLPAHDRRSAR